MAALVKTNRSDMEYAKFVDDGSGEWAVRTTATFAGNIGTVDMASEFAEDTQATAADKGIQILAVRNDAGVSLVGTDGDYAPLSVNATGQLSINLKTIRDATPPIGWGVADSGTLRVAKATALSVVKVADGQVKATAGTVFAMNIDFVGVTAGDKVELKNSADNSGPALITLVADAAAGHWNFCPSVGITYDTGIYVDETKSGGTFTVTVVYA